MFSSNRVPPLLHILLYDGQDSPSVVTTLTSSTLSSRWYAENDWRRELVEGFRELYFDPDPRLRSAAVLFFASYTADPEPQAAYPVCGWMFVPFGSEP